jgi:hypothetical protein
MKRLTILLFLVLPLPAQVDNASVNGTVTDASNAVLQGSAGFRGIVRHRFLS